METIEEPNLNLLKSNLLTLEISYQSQTQKLKSDRKKQDRLQSQLHTTRHQIEFYTQEYQKALECLKDSNWKITKEMCVNLRKLENPSPVLKDVCEKFMLALNQPDKSFESFLQLTKNFSYLKDLMTSVQGLPISETVISELLPIWKNQTIIQAKLAKTCKFGGLIAEWIGFIVEFTLKKETVVSSKRKEPEIEKKIRNQIIALEEDKNELEKTAEKLSVVRKEIEIWAELDKGEASNKLGASVEGGTAVYLNGLHRPTGSDGSGIGTGKIVLEEFPNFVDGDLYGDLEIDSQDKIAFEGSSESIGCCRLRFFCF